MNASSPRISARAQQMPASPIRRLAPVADDAKRRGISVYHLNIGQPDIPTPEPFLRRLKTIQDRVLAYTPSGGTDAALDAMHGYYRGLDVGVEKKHLLITTGGSEACLFAFMACCDVGDEAIVVEPFYTNYNAFATLCGVKLVALQSKAEDGFHLPSAQEFEAAVTPKTRMVVLCNPSNPTGTVYTPAELDQIASFCKKHNLFLVADEVYREFVYDGGKATSALSLSGMEQQVVVIDSLSKRYSACGIRLGCLVTKNAQVYEAALKMAQGRLSAPGIAQVLATGIEEIGPEYTRKIVEEYQARRDDLYEALTKIDGVFLRKPEGAFYLMPNLPIADADHFASWMLSDFSYNGTTVMMAPAPGFYSTKGLGKNQVRIAYVLNRTALLASAEILDRGLEAYAKEFGRP